MTEITIADSKITRIDDLPYWAVHKKKVARTPVTGKHAKTNDPSTFGTRGEADAALAAGRFDGLGFLVDESLGITAIDLDGVIAEDGSLPAPIQDIVNIADTYTELSPSGTGLHMIFGVADGVSRKNVAATPLCRKAEGYNAVRFMTYTGNRLPGTPETFSSDLDALQCVLDTLGLIARKPDPEPPSQHKGAAGSRANHELLELAFKAKNGEKISRLWNGDTSDYPSASEADAAFLSLMAFYCRDKEQLVSLLTESGLAREKFDRDDYVNRTVQFVLDNHNGETYTPPTSQATGRVTVNGAPDPGSTDQIDGDELLEDVYQFLGRFVAYPTEHARVAHALWVAHAHAMDAWESTPRIAFLSPEPASGKTRALEISELLVPNPVEAVNVSPAYLFRKVGNEGVPPTILFDEIDTVFGARTKDNNEEIRGLLNAGHRRGAVAGRCVVRGTVVETEEIPAYSAVALAGLGDLPDTILSRCVLVRMRRRRAGESVEPYRRRLHVAVGHDIRDQLAQWTASIADQLSEAWPKMPAGVEDRNADIWEPLFALADSAGGTWPERARVAAVALIADAQASTPSLGIQLLTDLRSVFNNTDKMRTDDVLKALCAMPESPWGDLRGKPLDSRRLSRMLRKYDVRSRNVRITDVVSKGYAQEDLYDAWERYLPLPPDKSATSATSATDDPAPAGNARNDGQIEPNGHVADSDTLSATNATYPLQPLQSATKKPHETGKVTDVADVADLQASREGRVKV